MLFRENNANAHHASTGAVNGQDERIIKSKAPVNWLQSRTYRTDCIARRRRERVYFK
jgi:hypothetical protein